MKKHATRNLLHKSLFRSFDSNMCLRVAHIFIVFSLKQDYRSRWNFEKMPSLTLKGLISYKVFPTNAIPFNLDTGRITEKGRLKKMMRMQ